MLKLYASEKFVSQSHIEIKDYSGTLLYEHPWKVAIYDIVETLFGSECIYNGLLVNFMHTHADWLAWYACLYRRA